MLILLATIQLHSDSEQTAGLASKKILIQLTSQLLNNSLPLVTAYT